MADLATLQSRLADAETAYHKLVTGTKTVEIQHGEMRQKYTETTMANLRAYIEDLKSQIEALGGSDVGQRRRMLEVNLGGM